MYLKMMYMVILYIIGFHQVVGVESPCPNNFQYRYDEDDQIWFGWISIPNPGYGTTKLTVEIASVEDISEKARISTLKSLDRTIYDLKKGRRLQYRIKLPQHRKLPTLNFIKVNGEEICTGPKVRNNVKIWTSSHILEYGVSDADSLPTISNYNTTRNDSMRSSLLDIRYGVLEPVQNQTIPKPEESTHENRTEEPLTSLRSAPGESQCGIQNTGVTALIYGGTEITTPNEYPWVVAIYSVVKERSVKKLNYICAGTLISCHYVLTAAHCTKRKKSVVVEFGRHNMANRDEHFEQQITYRHNFIEHPEYRDNSAHADIALLRIGTITFNQQMSPICMSSFVSNNESNSYKGTLVGWGTYSDDGISSPIPKQLVLNRIDQDECENVEALASSIADDTFCAQADDKPYESGPCHGDSGGGFYVKIDQKWYLRGIVSRSKGDAATCDVRFFSIFVDVAKYYNWISDIVD